MVTMSSVKVKCFTGPQERKRNTMGIEEEQLSVTTFKNDYYVFKQIRTLVLFIMC